MMSRGSHPAMHRTCTESRPSKMIIDGERSSCATHLHFHCRPERTAPNAFASCSASMSRPNGFARFDEHRQLRRLVGDERAVVLDDGFHQL